MEQIKVLKNAIIFIKGTKTLRLNFLDPKYTLKIPNPNPNKKEDFFKKKKIIKEEEKKNKLKNKINLIANILEDSFSGRKLIIKEIKNFDKIEKKNLI